MHACYGCMGATVQLLMNEPHFDTFILNLNLKRSNSRSKRPNLRLKRPILRFKSI